jgi:3-oxoacyl-[acyl-carrier-protein] synthase II
MTGHLLSGAAAMNALACLVALEHGAIPPTINLHEPDPECALCHVPNQAREQPVRVAVSNSLGFGGSNTTIVLRKAA